MSYKANSACTCGVCGKQINVGDEISWTRSTGGTKSFKYHLACKPAQAQSVPQAVQTIPAQESGDRSALLEAALRQFVSMDENKVREIASEIAGDIAGEMMKDFSPVSRELTIKVNEAPAVNVGLAHKAFEKLVKLASISTIDGNHINIYLHGPAGSGKSTGAAKLAKALNMEYGYTSLNPQTPESRLIGFIHAGGQYVATEFFKRYTQGGVFCLDEIDNAASSLVTTLNSLLENGHGCFPHGIFPRHKDFICICTANTIGRGGNINYPERRALDGAFIDRFHFLEWGYDNDLTRAVIAEVLGGASEADSFIETIDMHKRQIQAKYPSHIVSPRAYICGAVMKRNGLSMDDIKAAVIYRGVAL